MANLAKPLPVFLLLSALALGAGAQPLAPGMPMTGGSAMPAPEITAPAPAKPMIEDISAPFDGSFFLLPGEIAAIKKAMLGKPAISETPEEEISLEPLIPQHRVISISGLLYRSPQDWIVWMNGQKVTPEKLLPEIVDIKVESSSQVQLKWYDIGLDSVISISLRPHQTYDIATGILLPGSN